HGGTGTLYADGSFSYTPAAGFAGADTFTYTADDGLWIGDNSTPLSPPSNVATVTITVHDVPPPVVTLAIPPPPGSTGAFTTTPVTVVVTATDPSNVTSISCTDNSGSPIIVASGINTSPASANLVVSGEGTHSLICTATDGAGNAGAANSPNNSGMLKIDS